MERCQALTSAGSACKCKAREGHTTCKRHARKEIVPPARSQCTQIRTNGQRCHRECGHNDTLCDLHRHHATRRERDQRLREFLEGMGARLWDEHPPTTFEDWFEPVERIEWLSPELKFELRDALMFRWGVYLQMRPPPTVKPRTELHGLSMDKQNVHTAAIVNQTKSILEPLEAVPIPEGQDTLCEIINTWEMKTGKSKVIRDMANWYKVSECRKKDDHLYKRTLDAVWARIKLHEHKTELIERLWEECEDAVNLCCEGHISRLASVLVGFDEDAHQEVSVGERLQQRMAAIDAMELSPEEKVDHAWRVFTELNIPMQDRYAWVDAF